MRRALLVLAAALLPALASAQSPAANWQTIATPHFRIHYPKPYEAWARMVALRIESVRQLVSAEVGYTPPQVTDIVVMNPVAEPNGLTYPLLDAPRIVLYSESPLPESQIGEYHDWIDLLTVHETAHLVHLLRPSRNPLDRAIEHVLPLNPITLSAPRWVLEGYATVVEGRITGSGRPSSSMRAAILRKWAATGRMPTYSQLSANKQFLGMSMAYLAGSAYLEWLEARAGGDAYRKLWARMTARKQRSFDEAFVGVFGESPEKLYAEFTAELSSRALEVARGERASLREGELWQETTRASREPAVSPDGNALAMVIRDAQGRGKLVVYGTGPSPEEAKAAKAVQDMLRDDPQDVAPVRSKPLPHKALHTYVPLDGGDLSAPRWLPGGDAILFTHRQPDRSNLLHHDLFLWNVKAREVRRVTHLADVRDADPLPDGRRAIAVRSRFGTSQLVYVDLATGAVTPYNEPSLDSVYSHPRASRTGAIAWAQHDADKGWHIVVDGKDAGTRRGSFAPEWTASGGLVGLVAASGFIDVYDIRSDAQLTRVSGAAFDPAPAPDGSLYFMSLEPDGFVVRRLGSDAMAPLPPLALERSLVPVLPPEPRQVEEIQGHAYGATRAYGLGRPELSPLISGTVSEDQRSLEVGARIGDVVGRLDALVLASFGDRRGAAIAAAWRGWRFAGLRVHAFSEETRFGEVKHGVELRASKSITLPLATFAIDGGGFQGPRKYLFIDSTSSARQVLDGSRFTESARIALDTNHRYRTTVRAGATRAGFGLTAQFTAVHNEASVGGVPASILPESQGIRRVLDPALPPNVLLGRRYTGTRLELTTPLAPLTFFYTQHRLGERLRVAGAEWTLRDAQMPILKLPAYDISVGAARVVDERKTKLWLSWRWRP